MSELEVKMASITCQEATRRLEKTADRLEKQGDRVHALESTVERLATLVTVHAERDEDRWKQSRDEHKQIWKAIQLNNDRLETLSTKDKIFSWIGNASVLIAAASISGLTVWMLAR